VKEKLLEASRSHAAAVADIQKRVARYSGSQIQAESLLSVVRELATNWFDRVKPTLEKANFNANRVGQLSSNFDQLLRQGKTRPQKSSVLRLLGTTTLLLRETIHEIETSTFQISGSLSITPFIEGLEGDEVIYLEEAQRCLTVDALKACIVLGWCATISRIHQKIEELGYDVFSEATVRMSAKTTGRFKSFKRQFSIESRSELQTVFDTDLLWILEFMELIDNNQHQRLRHCFELRNNSAHPGLAPIKGPNLYAFYSDISEIVLKNAKFKIGAAVSG